MGPFILGRFYVYVIYGQGFWIRHVHVCKKNCIRRLISNRLGTLQNRQESSLGGNRRWGISEYLIFGEAHISEGILAFSVSPVSS